MAKSIIVYDKDLPEIPGRCPWEKPTSFLVKDPTAPNGWCEDTSGRRPSRLLLIHKLRTAVDRWRDEDYPGASDVTRRLFEYWFEEDHEVAGFPAPFRYHFCQREAIETLAYVVEVARNRDAKALVDAYAGVFQKDLLSKSIEFQTTMDGRRQMRRYVPELNAEGVQDLPPENLGRYAFKDGHGLGQDLGHGHGGRLVTLPQEACARFGTLHELPHCGPQPHCLRAAEEGFRQQPHLPQAATYPARVAQHLESKGYSAWREHRT